MKRKRNPPTRMLIYEATRDNPCVDCGIKYPPYVMEFDHCRGEKTRAVSIIARAGSVEALLAEIAKCDLVCANCHMIRTHKRRQGMPI